MDYRGFEIEIVPDDYPEDPRSWDNIGIMLCAHRRYALGDEQFDTAEALDEVAFADNVLARLPLYLMDHSMLTLKTSPFGGWHGRFDSGQVGYIVATEEQCEKMGTPTDDLEKLKEYLRGEVSTYNSYLRGTVVGYRILEEGEFLEGVMGYYDDDFCVEDAKACVDRIIRVREEKAEELNQRIVFHSALEGGLA